uniref:Outer membrane cobalamin receptor protein n=1 Tax=uncultured gamma proteobacterium HF4000_48J03 TaxID=723584 RepID=E7C8U9_9GAMM|nr:outer membrane cobalamin receptor protein [uncultured gamma proteobacterium HF4000_48J03]
MSNLIVAATKTHLPKQKILIPITILDAEDIALSGANNLSEILQFIAGIDVTSNGGPGQIASIFMHGSNSNHTLILINGIKINDSATGTAAIQNIHPDLIEKIEIIKAPRASLYGSNAVGGVINIITKKQTKTGYEIGYKTGSDNTDIINFMGGFHSSEIQGGIQFHQYKTDGFPARTESNVASGHENDSVNAFLNFDHDNWSLVTNVWQSSGTTEYLDFFLTPVSQDFNNTTGSLAINKIFSDRWVSNLNFGFSRDDIKQNETPDFNNSKKLFFEWQNTIHANDNHQIVAGIYLANEKFDASNYGLDIATEANSTALYIEDIINRGKHQLLTAARISNKEGIEDKITWNIEYGFIINPSMRLLLNAGRATRNPSSFDLYGYGGNPELTPEISKNIGIGIAMIPSDKLSIEFSAFSNEITDLITFNYNDFKLYNIEQARIRGIEGHIEYLANDWNIYLNATLQNPKNTTSKQMLLRRPKKTVSLGLRRSFGSLDFNMNILLSDSRMDFGGVKLDDYLLGNITLQYHLNERWLIRATINNITDESYMLANNYNTAKRKGYLGFIYRPKS